MNRKNRLKSSMQIIFGNSVLIICCLLLFLVSSCGEKVEIPLEVDETISGVFSEHFEVTNAILTYKPGSMSKLLVEVKKNQMKIL